jgi:hypothetical protein
LKSGVLTQSAMTKAIALVEENNLEKVIREEVIDLWMEIEESMKIQRKKKARF